MATLDVNVTASIADGSIANAKLGDMPEATVKGRGVGNGTGAPQDLDADKVSDILDLATDPFIRTSALPNLVTDDGNPTGVSPIGSAGGATPIELRRFVDGDGIGVQANTGSVQFNQKFSAADKFWYGGTLAAPTEGDITAAGRALLDDADNAAQRTTLGLGTAATQPSTAFDAAGSAAAAQAFAIQRANHTGTQLASTISDFAATVRATVLTGLSTASSAAVAATDTILEAFGKLQAFNNLFTTVGLAIARLANPSAVRFLRINADNTVTARSASELRTDLSLGTAALNNTGDFELASQTARAAITTPFTTNSASLVDVTGFNVTLQANSVYQIYSYVLCQSTNVNTGFGNSFSFTNSPTKIHLFVQQQRATAAPITTALSQCITSDDVTTQTTVAAANTDYFVLIRGMVITSANDSVMQARIIRGGSANNISLQSGYIIAHKIS